MEHACDQCGTAVEDGVPFCRQCGAPQIRVITEQEEPATPPPSAGAPADTQPAGQPALVAPSAPPAGIDWNQAVPAAFTAGVLLAVAWLVPFARELFWMLAGGVLAVVFYLRRRPHATVTRSLGARVGAIAGLIGFGVFAVILAIQMFVFRGSGQLRSMLQDALRQSAARNSDPQVQAIVERMMSPEGLALIVTVGMVMFLVLFVGCAALGGALGASLFDRRNKQ